MKKILLFFIILIGINLFSSSTKDDIPISDQIKEMTTSHYDRCENNVSHFVIEKVVNKKDTVLINTGYCIFNNATWRGIKILLKTSNADEFIKKNNDKQLLVFRCNSTIKYKDTSSVVEVLQNNVLLYKSISQFRKENDTIDERYCFVKTKEEYNNAHKRIIKSSKNLKKKK